MRISVADLEPIYIAWGYTDMRKSIDGLAFIVEQQFHLNLFSKDIFLFCGRRRNRFKALLWDGDGFVLLYKRLDNGRKNTAKSYMWCCCTSPLDQGPVIRIFKYFADGKGEFAKDILNGFHGVVMHDQYAGYNKLENVVHAGCLVHMRREFVNALPEDKGLRNDILAGQAIQQLKGLFIIENEIKDLSSQERVKERQKREKPLLDAFSHGQDGIAVKCRHPRRSIRHSVMHCIIKHHSIRIWEMAI